MQAAKLDFYNLNTQEFMQTQWGEFKKYIDGTYASLAFAYDDYNASSTFYLVITEAWGGLHRKIILTHGSAEAIDFLTNFAILDPRLPEVTVQLENIAEKTTKIKKKYDLSSDTVIYIGVAALGSLESDPVWVIKKTTFDINGNPTQLQWSADNVKWDDRTIISYT